MSDMRRCLVWVGLLAAATTLAGCPNMPVLSVSPLTITLGDGATTASITVDNLGGGSLDYTLTEAIPWLSLKAEGGSPASTVSGTVRDGVVFIQVELDKSQLPQNQMISRGLIEVTSNGGGETLIVSASQTQEPKLQVSSSSLDFGLTTETQQFTITNAGNGTLEYSLAKPATAPWLAVSPVSGKLDSFGSQATITVSVDRTSLAARSDPYSAVLAVASNGGAAQVAVAAAVPSFVVQPAAIDFGRIETAKVQSITISNKGGGVIPMEAAAVTANGGAWLTLDTAAFTLAASGNAQVLATANPAGLAPGVYTGTVTLSAPSIGYQVAIPVAMSISGFVFSPSTIDFGTIEAAANGTITLANNGTTPIAWQASVSPGAPWLTLGANTGTVTTTQNLTVTADPTVVNPGTYTGTIVLAADGVENTVTVAMARPRPPALKVAPQDIDLGDSANEATIALWNDGLGTINWTIDTAAFPAWLTLSPVDGSGVASGTATSDSGDTDTLVLKIDRTLVPAGQQTFSHAFVVQSSGDYTEPTTVTIKARAPKLPAFEIIAEGVDGTGTPYLSFDITETSASFIVRNAGQGDLSWEIDPTQTLPSWITSISPLQDSLAPGRQQTVTMSVNREGLTRAGAIYRMPIRSNDKNNPVRVLEVQVRVPFSIVIGTRPGAISFGRFGNTTILEVANMGDAGEYLDFEIESTAPWLHVEPAFGRSIGTPAGLPKDYRTISVAIDRSKINAQSASAKLIITAINVPPDAYPVEPKEITVTAEAAELTVESAVPNLRPPSLFRMNVLLRDRAYRAFPSLEDNYADANTVFPVTNATAEIVEDSLNIELTETNVFLKKNEKLRLNILLMLDFSGSMRATADALVLDGQLPAGPNDPLTELYIRSVGQFLSELPPHYQVGLCIFNERRPFFEDPIRMIYGADAANPGLAGVPFVNNIDVLQHRLRNMNVSDNGATQLLPAVLSAASTVLSIAEDNKLIPFDTADESFLLMFSDGRRTTPPGELTIVRDFLEAARVRFATVGWGDGVQANTLITLATGSGGHYYSTDNRVNADGTRTALADEMIKWCLTDPADPADASIMRDFKSHISLAYTSLNENATAAVSARFTVYDSTPPVQGTIDVTDVPFALYANDVRLGQIGMRTDGLAPGGTTSIMMYMDYAPRNINTMTFNISVDSPDPVSVSVALAPGNQGGLLDGWTLNSAGTVYSVTAPAGRVLTYGDFGDLLEIRVDGAVSPFRVRLNVLNPVYDTNPDGKYFTYPDSIYVEQSPFRATSFPLPRMVPDPPFTSPSSGVVNLGADEDFVLFNIYNLGGSHAPTGVWLEWIPRQGAGVWPGTELGQFIVEPMEGGIVTGTEVPDVLSITPDRCAAVPGWYSGEFYYDFSYGSVPIIGVDGPFWVLYEVEPPVLAVSTNTLDFGAAATALSVTVSNTGDSQLLWSVNALGLPNWLSVDLTNGALCPDDENTINVYVDRSVITVPGTYTFDIVVTGSNGATETISVSVVQP